MSDKMSKEEVNEVIAEIVKKAEKTYWNTIKEATRLADEHGIVIYASTLDCDRTGYYVPSIQDDDMFDEVMKRNELHYFFEYMDEDQKNYYKGKWISSSEMC